MDNEGGIADAEAAIARRLLAAVGGDPRGALSLAAQEQALAELLAEGYLTVELPRALPNFRGSEHEVWTDGPVALKATLPGSYGRLWGPRRFATPLEYLWRVAMMREAFALEWRVVGLAAEMRRVRLVSQQPFVRGDAPTAKEISAYLKSLGFRFKRHRQGDHWVRQADGLLAYDAEPGNVVKTPVGLVPIDLILQPADESNL